MRHDLLCFFFCGEGPGFLSAIYSLHYDTRVSEVPAACASAGMPRLRSELSAAFFVL